MYNFEKQLNEEKEKEERRRRRRRRRKIVYFLSCICFASPIAIFLIALIVPSNRMLCEKSFSMKCSDIPEASVPCDYPTLYPDPDPNTLKLLDCTAFCPVNGTNLDYKCNCINNYKWNSVNHTCFLQCKLDTDESCSTYPNNKKCSLMFPDEDILSCTSICEIGSKSDYECLCLNDLTWAKNDHKCWPLCPATGADCDSTKTYNYSCNFVPQDPYSRNCLSNCKDCRPATCECIPNKYNMIYWDDFNSVCAPLCENKPSDKTCAHPYIDGKFCYFVNTSTEATSCNTTCDSINGRAYDCHCFQGLPFNYETNKCNNTCRIGKLDITPQYDECSTCSFVARPNLICNFGNQTCLTECYDNKVMDYVDASCK